MRQVTLDDLAALRESHEAPCISLYQPTHRHHPDSEQDPIRFRNLRRRLELSLKQKYPPRTVRGLMKNYRELEHDRPFWNRRTDGLAILSSPDSFMIFELQRPVHELVIVASNFYTKPLIRILQSADRFQILCLSRQDVALYEGNRDALDPVDLIGVPATIRDALGEELTSPRLSVRSAPSGATVYFGGGQKPDEVDVDRDRFFRAVDRAILANHSRPSGLPLLLAALTEHHAAFRAVSRNPSLMPQGIEIDPGAVDLEELRRLAWERVEPVYLARLATLVERYEVGKSRQLASDDVAEIAFATQAGRVGTLLVEADRQIPGRIDRATARVQKGDLAHPDIGDVLNDLAEWTLEMKGEVVMVPAQRMPSSTGIAATYRY
jgi:hypothetical protein